MMRARTDFQLNITTRHVSASKSTLTVPIGFRVRYSKLRLSSARNAGVQQQHLILSLVSSSRYNSQKEKAD